MSEILKIGDHVGHVVSWGIREAKSGMPQVFVKTDLAGGLMWFGSLNEGKAREITLKALFVMGFCGNDLTELVSDPEALDVKKDIRFTVDHDTDETGKIRASIKWVNEISGSMKGQLVDADAIKALSALKLKGDILKMKQELKITDRPKTQAQSSDVSADEIPF
jgi:hypothetical protein